MSVPKFHVVEVSRTVDIEKGSFFAGWAVISSEEGQFPQFASPLFATRAEAHAEAKRLAEQSLSEK